MHSRNIIHGNLKSTNVLVDNHGNLVITDICFFPLNVKNNYK